MHLDQLKIIEQTRRGQLISTGKAFGTFGELLQGCIGEEQVNFLVTFPIDRYSYATFFPDPDHSDIQVQPAYKQKSQRLTNMILERYALPFGGTLNLESELPVGKGLASSSADLVATARCISSYFGLSISLSTLMAFMSEIEPSDGVMYPGVVSFYHRQVRLREYLGCLPPLTIIALDEGGELDTIEFNRQPHTFTPAEMKMYEYLLNLISAAIRKQDIKTVGRIASYSARLNQRLNPKQTLKDVIAICNEIRGLGVAVAHSGTSLGIILSPKDHLYGTQFRIAYHQLSTLTKNVLVYSSLNRKKEERLCR